MIDLSTVPTEQLTAELKRRYDSRPPNALTCCRECGHCQVKPIAPDGLLLDSKCRRCGLPRCEKVTADELAANAGLSAYAKIVLE